MPTISFRCDDETAEKIAKLSDEKGISKSEAIKQMIASGKVQANNKKDILAMMGELSRIGNNLNQIARVCNYKNAVDKVVIDQLARIEKQLDDCKSF
jgi:hypothetical protein